MLNNINYDLIPDHCRDGMRRYIEQGVIPGDFLQAVIRNDLVEAAAMADWINQTCLFSYAQFLMNNAPNGCWGSFERMRNWASIGGLQGVIGQKEGRAHG